MIREATADDLPKIVTLGRRFHEAAKLPGAFMPAVFWGFCEYLLSEENGIIFVSPKGMIGGLKSPVMWNCTYHIARESFWWAEDGLGQELLDAYEEWADDADQIRMSLMSSLRPDAVARILSGRGYVAEEIDMVKTW